MSDKKLGRPTNNPKNNHIKIRLDDETQEKLLKCSEKMNTTKSDVIRKGIHKMYDELD